jgi:putative membrane protein
MNTLQICTATRTLLVAAVVAATFASCSTSRKQPSPESSTATAATPAAQPTAAAANAKPKTTRAEASPEASTKSSNAPILAQIHRANLKEIALGNLAAEKASSEEVRNYAKQLVEDHTGADKQVVEMAQKMNIQLRNTRSKERQHESDQARLNKAAGPAFDREFLQETSADHEKLIKELKQEREDASDDDIEALIDKILPILEQHQQLVQILMKKEQA